MKQLDNAALLDETGQTPAQLRALKQKPVLVGTMLDVIGDALADMAKQLLGRMQTKVDSFESRVADRHQLLLDHWKDDRAALEARLVALEGQQFLTDGGVWQTEKVYSPGAVASFPGCLVGLPGSKRERQTGTEPSMALDRGRAMRSEATARVFEQLRAADTRISTFTVRVGEDDEIRVELQVASDDLGLPAVELIQVFPSSSANLNKQFWHRAAWCTCPCER